MSVRMTGIAHGHNSIDAVIHFGTTVYHLRVHGEEAVDLHLKFVIDLHNLMNRNGVRVENIGEIHGDTTISPMNIRVGDMIKTLVDRANHPNNRSNSYGDNSYQSRQPQGRQSAPNQPTYGANQYQNSSYQSGGNAPWGGSNGNSSGYGGNNGGDNSSGYGNGSGNSLGWKGIVTGKTGFGGPQDGFGNRGGSQDGFGNRGGSQDGFGNRGGSSGYNDNSTGAYGGGNANDNSFPWPASSGGSQDGFGNRSGQSGYGAGGGNSGGSSTYGAGGGNSGGSNAWGGNGSGSGGSVRDWGRPAGNANPWAGNGNSTGSNFNTSHGENVFDSVAPSHLSEPINQARVSHGGGAFGNNRPSGARPSSNQNQNLRQGDVSPPNVNIGNPRR